MTVFGSQADVGQWLVSARVAICERQVSTRTKHTLLAGADIHAAGGIVEVGEDGAHGGGVGDEGNDPHLAPTLGAKEREHFVDAGRHSGQA